MPNSKFQIPNSRVGSSTLELLIAFAILVLSISAGILVIFGNQSVAVDNETNTEALSKAQEMLEEARSKASYDFYSILSKSSLDPSGPITYTKTLDITNIGDFTKEARSTVSWSESGRSLNVVLKTLLTDPVGASGGDTCSPTLSGDWSDPQVLGYVDIISNEGATDIDILARKIYVTTNPSAAGQDDFYIFDASDPTARPMPDFGAGSHINTGPGLSGIHVAGKYAYVANMSRTAQLQIIDISNPQAPFLAKSFKLNNVTGAGSQAIGNSVFYANRKVYLGLTKTATGPEFNVIDLTDFLSDPSNDPVLVGSWSAGTRVNSIIVKDGIAYLATPWPNTFPPEKENLSILDVSTPSSIVRIDTFTAPDPTTIHGESLYISKDGNNLYLGRGGLNSANNPEFFSLDVSDPSNVIQIASKFIDATINALTVRSNFVFMITSVPSLGFQVWDLNNLGNATPYGSKNTQNTSTGGMDCEGNYIYIAQRSNRAVQIIGPNIGIPTVTINIHDASHNSITTANVGDKIHARSNVSGSGPTPTGKVEFTFYLSNNCSSGSTIDPNNPFTLDGSGSADPSSEMGPLNAGSYSFRAHYLGDPNYLAMDSSCKPISVAKVTPTVNTTILNSAELPVTSVPSGTTVHDRAIVSGSPLIPPTGTITFTLYTAKNNCTGVKQTETVPISSGVALSSIYTTLTKSISYKARYSGDINHNPADGPCEPLTVN